MRVVLINQARMTSTRLPGKVMMEVLGRSLLDIQMERLRQCRKVSEWVVATTLNGSDDPIVSQCQRLGVPCWRGPEDDVLSRFAGAAEHFKADWILRVTSDCPLVDPEILDAIILEGTRKGGGCDYASNTIERTYPRGLDGECFTAEALACAAHEARASAEREHVTPFIYRHPERFRIRQVRHGEDLSHHRWTVDTPEDFELLRRMVEALLPEKPRFDLQDCLNLLSAHPDWPSLNADVQQKVVH